VLNDLIGNDREEVAEGGGGEAFFNELIETCGIFKVFQMLFIPESTINIIL